MVTGVAERAIAPCPDQPRPITSRRNSAVRGSAGRGSETGTGRLVIGRSDADLLVNFGGFLRLDGRPKEAIKVSQPAVCLDPMPP